MATCINRLHPEFIELKEKLNVDDEFLALKIQSWQYYNNLDRMPTETEIKNWMSNLNSTSLKIIEKFAPFLNYKGYKVIDNKNILNKLYAANSGVDKLEKVIIFKDHSTEDVALQMAYQIYDSMGGRRSVRWAEVRKYVTKDWIKKEDIKKIYENKHKNMSIDDMITLHFVADVINDMINKNIDFSNYDLTLEYFEKAYFDKLGFKDKYAKNIIVRFFNKIYNYILSRFVPVVADINYEEAYNIIGKTIDNIFKQDFEFFYNKYTYNEKEGYTNRDNGEKMVPLSMDKIIKNDPEGYQIMNKILAFNIFRPNTIGLTGSLALSEQTTVIRKENELLHDLDFIYDNKDLLKNSPDFLERLYKEMYKYKNNSKKLFNKYKNELRHLSPIEKYLEDNFNTDKYSLNFKNLIINKDIITAQYDIKVLNNDNTESVYSIDIFYTNDADFTNVNGYVFQKWKNIVSAKYTLGREKDLNDIVLLRPYSFDKHDLFEISSDIFRTYPEYYQKVSENIYTTKYLTSYKYKPNNNFISINNFINVQNVNNYKIENEIDLQKFKEDLNQFKELEKDIIIFDNYKYTIKDKDLLKEFENLIGIKENKPVNLKMQNDLIEASEEELNSIINNKSCQI